MGVGLSHMSDEVREGGEMLTNGRSKGEGRARNLVEGTMNCTQRWSPISPKLRRVQEKARTSPAERFTSLAHHLTVEALRRGFEAVDS